MEQIKIKNLSFFYPECEKCALDDISLSVNAGEFILICGESGSGKTTLMRQLKKEIAPNGKRSGEILLDGINTDNISLRESAEKIGFVAQNPETQTVTDKVWHELAFGLENLGLDGDEIRARVSEMASYFGINEWFNCKTASLSGGQKQILNLASAAVMNPQVLILDEPTSQLDAISAESFLQTVSKINREFGITVIMSEQRLEEVFPLADRVIVMENGKIISDASPSKTGEKLRELPNFLQVSAPAAVKIFKRKAENEVCPVTVREGRAWLSEAPHLSEFKFEENIPNKKYSVELNEICFRYEKDGKDILKNLSLKIPEKSFFAVLGGNGTGKTTLMNIICGIFSPYSGRVKIFGEKPKKSKRKIVALAQNVQSVFTAKTVELDLKEIQSDGEKIREISELTKITELMQKHPFDLSGGEQQRAALAKALLCEPEILLLDEPTKGMDGEFKKRLAEIIEALKHKGCTVIMISHDIEFCAKYADYCSMLFDGEITATAPSREFFARNNFYTTSACRIARGIIKGAVTDEDIEKCLIEKSIQS